MVPLNRLRRRRGGTMTLAVVSLGLSLITLGVEMDAGRLFFARHQDQIIADSATMAASTKIPRGSEATAAANRIVSAYQATYNRSFTPTISLTMNDQGLATAVIVRITEPVPMFFPVLMGTSSRGTATRAAANRVIPSALLAGAVPIGVQYNTTFDLPSNGYASPSAITLKQPSKASEYWKSGNYGALRLPGDDSGANQWSTYLKYGYRGRMEVGQYVTPQTGNMKGPSVDALALHSNGGDTDSRFERAQAYPWNNDTYSNFDANNPRVVALPLVDWTAANGSSTDVPIKGFAAFWIDSINTGSGDITGRFIRYTVGPNGKPAWTGISIDPETSSDFDSGLWSAHLVE